jgi:hypothetical protein
MDDAAGVRARQPVGGLQREIEGLVRRQGAASDPCRHRLPLVARHGEENLALVGGTDLVDGADVGVVQGRGGAGLASKALPGSGIEVRDRGELQRHAAAEDGVLGEIDDPHPSGRHAGEHGVARDGRRTRLRRGTTRSGRRQGPLEPLVLVDELAQGRQQLRSLLAQLLEGRGLAGEHLELDEALEERLDRLTLRHANPLSSRAPLTMLPRRARADGGALGGWAGSAR